MVAQATMPLLDISNLRKAFASPDGTPQLVVDIPAFQLARREQVGLRGGSGAGKTTFLHLIAGILIPDAGSIWLDGAELQALHEAARDRFRAMCIGYVFQSFNLLQGLTCLENVLVAMSFGRGADRSAAEALLRRVGLGHRLHHRPRQLSSGQQQRVAVARALANHPRLVLADEPTGNLDEQSGAAVLRLIRDTCHETEAALLLVSHDREVLAGFDRLIDFPVLNCACTHAPPQPPTPNSELRP